MGPYKCPDCWVWWAGTEHRCEPGAFGTTTTHPEFPLRELPCPWCGTRYLGSHVCWVTPPCTTSPFTPPLIVTCNT